MDKAANAQLARDVGVDAVLQSIAEELDSLFLRVVEQRARFSPLLAHAWICLARYA